MKAILMSLAILGASLAHADESTATKVDDVKRSLKKGAHKVEEAVCAEGDLKCAAKKVKHRAEEGVDYGKDKVKETKKGE